MPLLSLPMGAAVLWLFTGLGSWEHFVHSEGTWRRRNIFLYHHLAVLGKLDSGWVFQTDVLKRIHTQQKRDGKRKKNHRRVSTGSLRHCVNMQIYFCCFHAIVISSEKSKANVTFQPAAAQPQLGSQHLLRTGEAGGCNCPNVKYLSRHNCTWDFQQGNKAPCKADQAIHSRPTSPSAAEMLMKNLGHTFSTGPTHSKISKRWNLQCTKPIAKVRFSAKFPTVSHS